jgi:anthranilate phosphoribosyltransferase
MATLIDYINPLLAGEDLSQTQAGALLDTIFGGEVPEAQVAAFLTAMRAKGATAPEVAGLAGSLRSHAVKVEVDTDNLVDTCGTGGGSVKTCNVSTAAAIVAAGAGVRVAKHGNRGITSACGSADVLEALGVKIDASPELIAACIDQAGVGFMFAPMFHPAMKFVQPIRKALGFRTVFNILGPLANPAGAGAQILGVADAALTDMMIESLKLLGTRYAMVVHSRGLDEISILGPTTIVELREGVITRTELDPRALGIAQAQVDDIKADNAAHSAQILQAILRGEDTGPRQDIVLLNAAGAIIAGGLARDFETAFALAQSSVSSGKAQAVLNKMIDISNS